MFCSMLVELQNALDSGVSFLGTANLDRQIVKNVGLGCAVGVTANYGDLTVGELPRDSNNRAPR